MKRLSIVLLSAIAAFGCAQAPTAGLSIDGQSQRVIMNDNALGGRLDIENIDTDEVNGHARGIVRLASQYKGDQHVQYRFYWYDDKGLEVNSKPGAWRKVIVRGFETISISEVSVNPNATQYRVQIRQANN